MIFATVLLVLVLAYLLSYLALKPLFNDWELPEYNIRRQRWEERFGVLKGWWTYIFAGSGLLGVLCAVIVYIKLAPTVTEAWFPMLVFGLLGFFFGIMGTTDFFTQKAPLDVQDLTLAVIAPIGVLGVVFNLFPKHYPQIYFGLNANAVQIDDLYQFGPFFVFVLIMVLLWITGLPGMGAADIAVLGIAAFGLGAMIGLLYMCYALIAACLLQIVAHFVGNHFGWGKLVSTPYGVNTRGRVNALWYGFTGSKREIMGTTTRQLQWLPVLCLSYLVCGIVFV